MRLGEASGAALALGLLKGALACHRDMATFEQAGVSGKSAEYFWSIEPRGRRTAPFDAPPRQGPASS